ncbi:hypothetical protein GF324_12505, partial [bacterium]|nr:hypothetical protein [bacterium]
MIEFDRINYAYYSIRDSLMTIPFEIDTLANPTRYVIIQNGDPVDTLDLPDPVVTEAESRSIQWLPTFKETGYLQEVGN